MSKQARYLVALAGKFRQIENLGNIAPLTVADFRERCAEIAGAIIGAGFITYTSRDFLDFPL